MGRTRTIDREAVLDAAEQLVAERGAGALTMGMVADAAGISKGGVQSAFGTKEGLIAAMLERWMLAEQQRFQERVGRDTSARGRIRAHLRTTKEDDVASQTRVASLLAVLVQSPEHMAVARTWYRKRVGDLMRESDQTALARIAFLAAEGAFFLRYLNLVPFDEGTWESVFTDLDALLTR